MDFYSLEEKRYKNIQYVVRKPLHMEAKKYPILIFMAGAGSRGTDLSFVRNNPFFTETNRFFVDAITYAPQCYEDTWFDMYEQILEFIDDIRQKPYVDQDRVYLMGASMGGYAVWQLAMSQPDWFAAIVPICGGGMYWNASRLKNVSIWAFHGSEDTCVFCEESKKMTDAVKENGGRAKLTVLEGVGHDAWNHVYCNQEVFAWLMEQKRICEETEKSKYDNAKQYG